MSQDLFYDVEEKYAFWLSTGKKIRNLKELMIELQINGQNFFNNHVNDSKNDFANWVRDIFKDHVLANKLYNTKDLKNTIDILYVWINVPKPKSLNFDRISVLLRDPPFSAAYYFRMLGTKHIMLNIPTESLLVYESRPNLESISNFLKEKSFVTRDIVEKSEISENIVFEPALNAQENLEKQEASKDAEKAELVEDTSLFQYIEQMNTVNSSLNDLLEKQKTNPMHYYDQLLLEVPKPSKNIFTNFSEFVIAPIKEKYSNFKRKQMNKKFVK